MTVNGRTEAPYDVLQPREALLEAARLNRRALDVVAESNQDGGTSYDWELLDQAAQLAAVAHALAAYAEAGRWTP